MEMKKRVAVVQGLRTPFVKSGTDFKDLSSLELGKIAAVELINRTEIDPSEIDKVLIGTVIPSIKTSNLAREIALGSGVPPSVPAFTVTSACASANQAFTSGVDSILSGESDVVLTGGVESISDFPVLFSKKFRDMFFASSKGKNILQKTKPFLKMGIGDVAPDVPSISERSTGLTMGEAAEKMAMIHKISRQDQDYYALRSHNLASDAQKEGVHGDEIVRTFVPPGYTNVVTSDNAVKDGLDLETLSSLEPVFDSRYGTITSGNSAPLSDGGAVILLMSEDKAKALGYKPMGYVRSYAYGALDPGDELLMGTAYSTPAALERAGLTLRDIGLIEMHESFSAQVLANLKAFSSKKFAREKLGKSEPIGDVPLEKLNVSGGSIAIGHPFGATGARLIITLLWRLARRNANFGLVTLSAAGGIGVSIVIEKE
jgi:acetyl-CoA acyltransferase